MAQRPSFDFAKLSTASKILLVASGVYIIDSFLPYWNRVCVSGGFGFPGGCAGTGLWHDWGILAGLLAIAILAMEVITILGVQISMGTPQLRNQIEAGLAGGVLLFTLLRIIVDRHFLSWGAWLGLILAIAIAYGGWMRWQEAQLGTGTSTPPPPPPSPGGFSA
jgi:hypothetical protein